MRDEDMPRYRAKMKMKMRCSLGQNTDAASIADQGNITVVDRVGRVVESQTRIWGDIR
jgi:hypothetical protein